MAVAWTCDRGGCGQVIRGIADLAELELRVPNRDGSKLAEGKPRQLCPECRAQLDGFMAGAALAAPWVDEEKREEATYVG